MKEGLAPEFCTTKARAKDVASCNHWMQKGLIGTRHTSLKTNSCRSEPDEAVDAVETMDRAESRSRTVQSDAKSDETRGENIYTDAKVKPSKAPSTQRHGRSREDAILRGMRAAAAATAAAAAAAAAVAAASATADAAHRHTHTTHLHTQTHTDTEHAPDTFLGIW